MKTRPLGKSGMNASVIGLGAWAIGGWMWGGTAENDAIGTIHAAIDEGITLIDTAPIYGLGRSEELIGKALAGRRDRVVLATKCGLQWHEQRGVLHLYSDDKGLADGENGTPVYKYLGADSIRRELEDSLRRLKTDVIDLYQTHWPDPTTATEDVMATLLKLKEEGKIRAIGASNVTLEHVKAYQGVGQLDAVQQRYSMLDRKDEDHLLPFCRDHKIAYLAYSPMAMGLLTGKIGPERTFGEGDIRAGQARFSQENRHRVAELLEAIRPIAEDHDLTFAQLVMAWTLRQPGLSHVLAGARSPHQAIENAKAGRVVLADADMARMGEAISRHVAKIV